MRLIVCFIPLLCGCSTQLVHCDVHLLPINSPVPGGAASALVGSPGAAAQSAPPRRAP
jgi:hypothetical protein